jgi:hypothetical protein
LLRIIEGNVIFYLFYSSSMDRNCAVPGKKLKRSIFDMEIILQVNQFLLFKPPRWYFIIAALANQPNTSYE